MCLKEDFEAKDLELKSLRVVAKEKYQLQTEISKIK